MRRLVTLLMAGLMVLALFGCTTEEPAEAPEAMVTSDAPGAPPPGVPTAPAEDGGDDMGDM